jgi:hypothetical protein
MDLNQILAAFQTHNWNLLVLLAAMYFRVLCSDKSKFPVTMNPNLLPLFSGLAGAVVATDSSLIAGKPWSAALLVGFAGLVGASFFDGLLTAMWGKSGSAPGWATTLVGIVDDAGKATGATPAAKKALIRFGSVSLLAMVCMIVGCTAAQVHADDAIAIDLTAAVCAAAADSPIGQPYTDVVCSIAGPVEQGIGTLTSGQPTADAFSATGSVKTVRLRIPTATAAKFLADHSPAAK